MNTEEFRSKMSELLPDATPAAMNHWLRFADEMESSMPNAELLKELYIAFSLVDQYQDRETATALFDLATTICLHPHELPEAGRLVYSGISTQEIVDRSIAGQLELSADDSAVYQAARDLWERENQDTSAPITMKLYSPVDFLLHDFDNLESYNDTNYWRDELTHEEAFKYMGEIEMELDRDMDLHGSPAGLAQHLNVGMLEGKVVSIVPSFELHDDKIWTVAEVQLTKPLTALEREELKAWWGGQLSDGWGEGFEQKAIQVAQGELYVIPWTASHNFFIATQVEFDRRMGRRIEHSAAPELHSTQLVSDSERDSILLRIAQRFCHVDPFIMQGKDRLLRDVPVWELQSALIAAFDQGQTGEDFARYDNVPPHMIPESTPHPERNEILEFIARQHCGVETLAIRQNKELDNHNIPTWNLKTALEAAFEEGQVRQVSQERTGADPARVSDSEQSLGEDRLDSMSSELLTRITGNLSDYCESLMGTDKRELVGMSEEIATRFAVRDYMLNHHKLLEPELVFLLQFRDPLEVLAEHCPPPSKLLEMSGAIHDITALDGALKKSYPLVHKASSTELRERFAQNKEDMLYDLRLDIAQPGLAQSDMVELAQKITAVVDAHTNLEDYPFSGFEVEYLLQFENPLAIVVESWPTTNDLIPTDVVIEDILGDRASHADHPKVQGPTAEVPPRDQEHSVPLEQPTGEKEQDTPSLLDSLHREQARTSTPRDEKSAGGTGLDR